MKLDRRTLLIGGGAGIGEGELRSFLEGKIAKFKVPERFIFADSPLPRLGTGKIDRRGLKDKYAR